MLGRRGPSKDAVTPQIMLWWLVLVVFSQNFCYFTFCRTNIHAHLLFEGRVQNYCHSFTLVNEWQLVLRRTLLKSSVSVDVCCLVWAMDVSIDSFKSFSQVWRQNKFIKLVWKSVPTLLVRFYRSFINWFSTVWRLCTLLVNLMDGVYKFYSSSFINDKCIVNLPM